MAHGHATNEGDETMSKSEWTVGLTGQLAKNGRDAVLCLLYNYKKEGIPPDCPLAVSSRVLAVKMQAQETKVDESMMFSVMMGCALVEILRLRKEIKRLQSLVEHG